MKQIRLASIGVGLPEQRLTNQDLSKLVDTSDEWIVQRTGIRERRIAGKDLLPEDMATTAAKDCLSKTELKPDLVISSTNTTERTIPYQSSVVANRLELEGIAAFDISAACSGMVYGIGAAWGMMETLGFKNALITASERMTAFTDYTDRASCVLFGDGASSILLSSEASSGPEVLAVRLGTDAKGANLITMGARDGNRNFWQDGKAVYLFVVSKVIELMESLRKAVGLGKADPFYVVPHSANRRMFEAIADRCGFPMERMISNIDRFGNTSSASIGISLEEAWREQRFKPGDVVFLIGYGAGLSWGGAALRW